MPPSRPALRWLLRMLASPELLRLILDERAKRPPPFSVRHAWEMLQPRGDWTGEGQREAACWLADRGILEEPSPAAAWVRLVRDLRDIEQREELDNLVSYCSLPALFLTNTSRDPSGTPSPGDLTELHAHLRGSVPWGHLWARWMQDGWARAALRGHRRRLEAGGAGWSWAELLHEASELVNGLPARERAGAQALDEGFVARTLEAGPRTALSRAGVPLLAIATALRADALYRRGADDGRAGLASFQEAYDRYSKAQRSTRADSAELARLCAAVLNRFWDEGVGVLELRPTLERKPADLARRLFAILWGYLTHLRERPASTLALGLVPSLYKQEPAGRDPEAAHRRVAIWEEQTRMLLALLEQEPLLRWFVVGLDAAGGERGCPPRMLTRPYAVLEEWHRAHGVPHRPGLRLPRQRLRETASKDRSPHRQQDSAFLDVQELAMAARQDPAFHPGWPRLGRTVHVGEDFVDPVTGLRHIDEAMRELSLGEGDRLGHALAAGLEEGGLRAALNRRGDVRRLPDGTWEIWKPAGEHALDLSWLAREVDDGDRAWAISELSRTLAQSWADPRAARALLARLDQQLPTVELPGALYDREAADEARVCVHLDRAWERRFHQARARVLAEIRARRLVVESCPSSNIAVANLDAPPARALIEELGLDHVAICTDDAGLFDAWPRQELGRVVELGDAEWRSALLRTARRAAFTQPT